MYEEQIVETGEIVEDAAGFDSPLSADGDDGIGDADLSSSGRDISQDSDDVFSGIESLVDLPVSGDVSGSDLGFSSYMEAAPDYTETLLSMQESISSLHSTLFLILIFLLLSWTEKKIRVGVNKFTRERRR